MDSIALGRGEEGGGGGGGEGGGRLKVRRSTASTYLLGSHIEVILTLGILW